MHLLSNLFQWKNKISMHDQRRHFEGESLSNLSLASRFTVLAFENRPQS